EVAPLAKTRALKRSRARGVSTQSDVARTHQISLAGSVADGAGLPIILLHCRQNEIGLQLKTLAAIPSRCSVAGILQITGLEQDDVWCRHRVTMHSERPVTEHLHARAHVVLHEHAAIAASLIPVAGQPIAIPERGVEFVAVIHHQTVSGPVQTIEQPELLFRAAQAVARRKKETLRDRHSQPRVEVPLQDSVIATRLVSVVAL